MTHSGFDFNGLPTSTKAQGYQFWSENEPVSYKHYDSTFAFSAGSIYSTTNDLSKWSKAISDKKILREATWILAFTPRINNYGYGWQTGQFLGNKYVKHSGGYPGYMSEFIFYPDQKITIVLLNNFGTYDQNVWSVGMGISCILYNMPYDNWKARKEVNLPKEILQKQVGTYELNKKTRILIKLLDGRLYAKITGLPDIQIHAETENDYYFESFNTSLHFRNVRLIIHEHGQDSEWKKKD